MAELDLLPYEEYVAQLPRKVMSAGVLLRDQHGRVLLVEPSYKPFWEIPGGVVEHGEAPWDTARRELYEETGLDRTPGGLLVIDHVPPENDSLPERVAFVFDGGLVDEHDIPSLRLGAEIVSAALHNPADAAPKVKPLLASRLAAAIQAATTGITAMCQHGNPVR